MKLFRVKNKDKFSKTEDFYKINPSFCIMPWVHFHVTQEGYVTPCCQAKWDKELAFGEINSQSIQQIWKSKKMETFRKGMLKGKKDERCLKCYEKESNGWTSLRNITNAKYSSEILKVANGRNDEFGKPIYLDIRFSNKCNLKCRICGPWSSSSWTKDYSVLTGEKYQEEYITYGVKDEQKFFIDFIELLPDLREIYFAGGEPLMIDTNYHILSLLIEHNRTDVALFYNSNLTVLDYKKPGITELWKNFTNITVAASIDDYGEQFEFHRKNADWELTKANLFRIKESNPQIHLILSPTISIYNICRITGFHKNMVELGIIETQSFVPTLLTQPDYYNIQILPLSLKEKIRTDITEHIDWIKQRVNISDPQAEYILAQFSNIIRYMFAHDRNTLWPIFIEKEKRLDHIRKENFFSTFSEYADLQE